jgi:hypothetical protein
MKRALVLLFTVAAVTAGCGSSSGSSSSSGGSSSGGSSSVSTDTAAGVLAAASAATKDATSAAFDAKLGVTVAGTLQSAGAGAALLRGPLTFDFKGNAGKGSNGKPKFDVHFAFNYTGGSFTGEALSPDGKTLYLQLPALMGPGWHSTPLQSLSSAGQSNSTTSGGLQALKTEGLDPSKWLKNLSLSTSGGQDTISADLNLPALIADVAKAGKSSGGAMTPKTARQLAQIEKAVTKAHGSLSFDSSTHFPTNENLQFAMTVPKALSGQASGLRGVALNLNIIFSDWNKDFTVTAPKGATPLNTGGLLGGLSGSGA